MTSLFSHLKQYAPKIYLAHVLHTCGDSFEDHLKHLETILEVLEKASLQVNANKSTWCATGLEFLGFWVTCEGYHQLKSRVQAILAIAPPTTIKQVQMFVGCTNFVKNHVPKRAEILEPITKLIKKGEKYVWGTKQQEAFEKIKVVIAEMIILVYLEMNRPFILYTDSSDIQLGGLLVQVDPCLNLFSKIE